MPNQGILGSSSWTCSPFVRKWRNWQTRKPQELVAARQWRFKSSLPHHSTRPLRGLAHGGPVSNDLSERSESKANLRSFLQARRVVRSLR